MAARYLVYKVMTLFIIWYAMWWQCIISVYHVVYNVQTVFQLNPTSYMIPGSDLRWMAVVVVWCIVMQDFLVIYVCVRRVKAVLRNFCTYSLSFKWPNRYIFINQLLIWAKVNNLNPRTWPLSVSRSAWIYWSGIESGGTEKVAGCIAPLVVALSSVLLGFQ